MSDEPCTCGCGTAAPKDEACACDGHCGDADQTDSETTEAAG